MQTEESYLKSMQYIWIVIQLSIWQSQASFCLSADFLYAWYIGNRTWFLKTSLHLRYFIFCFLIYIWYWHWGSQEILHSMFPNFVIYLSVQDKSNRIVPMNREIATQLWYSHTAVKSNTRGRIYYLSAYYVSRVCRTKYVRTQVF